MAPRTIWLGAMMAFVMLIWLLLVNAALFFVGGMVRTEQPSMAQVRQVE